MYTSATDIIKEWAAGMPVTIEDQNLNEAARELYEAGETAKEQMHIGLSAIQKLIEYHPENKALKRMEAEMKQAIEQMSAALSKARGKK